MIRGLALSKWDEWSGESRTGGATVDVDVLVTVTVADEVAGARVVVVAAVVRT